MYTANIERDSLDSWCCPRYVRLRPGGVGLAPAHAAEVGLVHQVRKGCGVRQAAGLDDVAGVGKDVDALAAGLALEVRAVGAAADLRRGLHGSDGRQPDGPVADGRVVDGAHPGRLVVVRRRVGGVKGVRDGDADAGGTLGNPRGRGRGRGGKGELPLGHARAGTRELAPGRSRELALRDARAGPGPGPGDLRVLRGRLEDEVGAVRVWLDDGLRDEVAKRCLAARGATAAAAVEVVAALLGAAALPLLLPAEVEEDDDGDDEEDDAAADDAADDGRGGGARILLLLLLLPPLVLVAGLGGLRGRGGLGAGGGRLAGRGLGRAGGATRGAAAGVLCALGDGGLVLVQDALGAGLARVAKGAAVGAALFELEVGDDGHDGGLGVLCHVLAAEVAGDGADLVAVPAGRAAHGRRVAGEEDARVVLGAAKEVRQVAVARHPVGAACALAGKDAAGGEGRCRGCAERREEEEAEGGGESSPRHLDGM